MSYARFQPMIESASAFPQFWRVCAGLTTVITVCVLWAAALFLVIQALTGGLEPDLLQAAESPLATVVFLLLIVGLGAGTWVAGLMWHRRGLGALIGRGPRTLRDFTLAVLVTWTLAGLAWAVFLPFSDPLTPNLPFAQWIRWLPVALVVILLQTGSEELLFRGYLQSQLAARFRATWIWMLVPACMFGALHFVPGEAVGPGLIYVASTTLFGVIAADLTARSGSIGAAWGLHFANNCMALLVIVYVGAASGLGLYSAGTIEDALSLSPLLILDIGVLVVLWLAIRRMVTV